MLGCQWIPWVVWISSWSCIGCGYTLQTSQSPLRAKTGIHKVFIQPFQNTTSTRGVEHDLFEAVNRSLNASGRIELVGSVDQADALLTATVLQASYKMNATVCVSDLQPHSEVKNLPEEFAHFPIAASYLAILGVRLSCQETSEHFQHSGVSSSTRRLAPYHWNVVWEKTAPFGASNQLGELGTTSTLINFSSFHQALSELSSRIAADLSESLLSIF